MHDYQFHPAVAKWFEQRFESPTEPQRLGWPRIQAGGHVLISAPTGSGKTLAAFLASLDILFREALEGTLPDETRLLYVSPLKALSNDIRKNLEEPLAGIQQVVTDSEARTVTVRAEVRTGDTPAARRQAIAKKPPHILVTTPESFYLLLTSVSGRAMLRTVRTLIVDEIHALVDDRRGAHLALSMERLDRLTGGPVQRIGLSATQKPIEEVARFLVGTRAVEADGSPRCAILDSGRARRLDLAVELPGSPLEAVMSNEVWEEVYRRLAELIGAHRTTLVFVNTRRLAERVTHHLSELIGADKVTSHHGSLSAELRLEAEDRLKRGQLKALVATASLELGIDIGSVDLVCQLGSTRSISTCLQRVGRAEHQRGGLPKGRLFPLSRDELAECTALLQAVQAGDLDTLEIPSKPLDVLAQQFVATAAGEDVPEEALFELARGAWPYRDLTRREFDQVVAMLANGFSTKRGRRAALIHYDAVHGRVRGRRGARLLALTSGGAIPDTADYRVVVEPTETFIGTVNEDFAVESMAGDVFQLGNASWRILRVNSSQVRVEDAHGQPPGIPFWLGEAPGRSGELSRALSGLRSEMERRWDEGTEVAAWLERETGLDQRAAVQLTEYYAEARRVLGAMPTEKRIVMERFFDESGGMQLVLHAPVGSRINRAWGLALRKRFCRSFNFELQAAATDDAVILSLGTQHSFPLEEVFRYLNSKTVRGILVQALLDAPMFTIRWRWNATRSLAIPRRRGGQKVPAPLQRMEAENLIAAVFPDQLACLENIAGDREIPDHPLVKQAIDDCLTEAMDIEGLENLLRSIEAGQVECLSRDLPEPSPLAHEILNARPYAFLDNAPLEERRARAVYTRRASEPSSAGDLGILDGHAIAEVVREAWPTAGNADELHDALLLVGVMTEPEMNRDPSDHAFLQSLVATGRAGKLMVPSRQVVDCGTPVPLSDLPAPPDQRRSRTPPEIEAESRPVFPHYVPHSISHQNEKGETGQDHCGRTFWIATERLPMLRAVYPEASVEPALTPPPGALDREWPREEAVRELARGRLEACGPTTASQLRELLGLAATEIESALLALEREGFVLRGKFHPEATELEWCDRRLLARIHRLTINKLRAEIEPVSVQDYFRFLLAWQHVDRAHRAEGPEGLAAVLELLDGYELPLAAWEPEVFLARLNGYEPLWLDRLCLSGRAGWGRLNPPRNAKSSGFAPLRSSPVALFLREHASAWLELAGAPSADEFRPETARVLEALDRGGAMFFTGLVARTRLFPSHVEQALSELAALGRVTADSFDGVRALLVPSAQRPTLGRTAGRQRHKQQHVASIEFAGRWSLLRPSAVAESGPADGEGTEPGSSADSGAVEEPALELYARVLLHRYGVVFRRLLEREPFQTAWFELGRIYRRWEARGQIRGGHFIAGVSGEQFALPEAIGLLRSVRKAPKEGERITLSGADPLNLIGILTPGPRLPALASNRILFRDGLPIAALEAGEIRRIESAPEETPPSIESALRLGTLPVVLRPYYG
jgi:ATP-dependent helicase Lhr and Lhr-like helicase